MERNTNRLAETGTSDLGQRVSLDPGNIKSQQYRKGIAALPGPDSLLLSRFGSCQRRRAHFPVFNRKIITPCGSRHAGPEAISKIGAALLLFPLGLASAKAADKPFTDPVAYCQAVGDIDAPDARYTGPTVPDWMVTALYTRDEIKAQKEAKVDPARAVVWRCMQGKVWACVQGNAPICGKANQETRPTNAMREFCAGQPNAEVIPLFVIGHENPMIYDWSCRSKTPTIGRQTFTVDARGFPAELWKVIAPAHRP